MPLRFWSKLKTKITPLLGNAELGWKSRNTTTKLLLPQWLSHPFVCMPLPMGFPDQTVKSLPAVRETWDWSLGWKDPLEKEMATHSSILAWRIPWTEEPGGLQSTGSQSWTQLSDFTFTFKHSFQLYPLLCSASTIFGVHGNNKENQLKQIILSKLKWT